MSKSCSVQLWCLQTHAFLSIYMHACDETSFDGKHKVKVYNNLPNLFWGNNYRFIFYTATYILPDTPGQ